MILALLILISQESGNVVADIKSKDYQVQFITINFTIDNLLVIPYITQTKIKYMDLWTHIFEI